MFRRITATAAVFITLALVQSSDAQAGHHRDKCNSCCRPVACCHVHNPCDCSPSHCCQPVCCRPVCCRPASCQPVCYNPPACCAPVNTGCCPTVTYYYNNGCCTTGNIVYYAPAGYRVARYVAAR